MDKRPRLYDHNGLPIVNHTSEIDNLSPAVQALIEARVNTAISNIKDHNSIHLETLAQKHASKWRILTGFFGLLTVILAFYAPPQILDAINAGIDKKLTEPMLKASADRVIADKMSTYVDEKMVPLQAQTSTLQATLESTRNETLVKQAALVGEQHNLAIQVKNVDEKIQSLRDLAAALQASLKSTQKEVKDKQAVLVQKQLDITKQIRITELAVAAKAGSRSSYNELLSLQDAPGQPKDLINASLKEIELYFDADRSQLSYKTLIKLETMKNPGYAVDEVVNILRVNPSLMEAAINTLADLKSQGAVHELCSIVQKSDDLRTAARATRALEVITGEKTRPLDFDKVVKWWKENASNSVYNGSYDAYIKVTGVRYNHTISKDEGEMLFKDLDVTIASDPDALHSRCLKAGFALMFNKPEVAKQLLDEVRGKRKDYYWLHVWDAAYQIKMNNLKEAVKLINLALPKSPTEVERNVKYWNIFAPIRDNDAIDWPSKKTSIVK